MTIPEYDFTLPNEQRVRRTETLESGLHVSGSDPELLALHKLVGLADGRAPRECATILAANLSSPWCATRDLRDGSSKVIPPNSAFEAVAACDLMGAADLPTLDPDRGLARFMSALGLATPVAEIDRGPDWLADLPDGSWLPAHPRGRYSPTDQGLDVISKDGRLAALLGVVGAVQDRTKINRDDLTLLVQWCVGARAAVWSDRVGQQCRQLRVNQNAWDIRAWRGSYMNQTSPQHVVQTLLVSEPFPAGWEAPAEIQAAERLAAAQAEHDRATRAEWERRAQSGPQRRQPA